MLKNFVQPKPQPGQEEYVRAIRENDVTICTGLAGTGKTFLALAEAVDMINRSPKRGGIQRVVIIRPYIPSNTGEKIGALPGTLEEKVLPYVESIKDNLRVCINNEQDIAQLIQQKFEFTVLSMCRGRSFNNCFVIVEEAQNVPLDGAAMKMILTRIGKSCKMVIAGDLDQCDIDTRDSALTEAINVLDGVRGVGLVEMNDVETVQRSRIVKEVLKAYKRHEKHG
ncbi:MAG: PhoH family protein [Hydrogenophaga sp.]|uniref:PhoH family protein n=1 Tax=Hydrogenophaga sp. TaxID=1904254 RepID=UPI00260EE97D|nr:PhoH family protein [Hydrogenophaga sp.]MCV0439812.1 PhoH family protein [Hydrogenophaga sp.]